MDDVTDALVTWGSAHFRRATRKRDMAASGRRRAALAALLVVVVAFVALTARLFVWPDVNQPARADAIVVLGGGGQRIPEGIALARAGYAPLLVLSVNRAQSCVPSTRTYRSMCFVPDPATTRGEAEEIGTLARSDHLHRVIVVASTPQATRARLRIGRCYSGQLLVVGVSPGNIFSWAYDIAYEWGALAKALVAQTSC